MFDEISTRKMDEDSRKTGGSISKLNVEDVKEEYEEVEVWSEE